MGRAGAVVPVVVKLREGPAVHRRGVGLAVRDSRPRRISATMFLFRPAAPGATLAYWTRAFGVLMGLAWVPVAGCDERQPVNGRTWPRAGLGRLIRVVFTSDGMPSADIKTPGRVCRRGP